jgi:ubiquinone/menaquinone biosynthesis C-methylase UbiE
MNKNYYREYFDLERNHWWFVVRLKILKSLIAKQTLNTGIKILNVGVATGATSQMLKEYGEVTSLEFDKDCCDFVNENTDLNVVNGSVLDLHYEANTFDLVCCFDVIEHVADDDKAIEELFRVCKKDGLVFVTVPAFQFLWSKHDEVNHHFRRYTMKSFSRLIEQVDPHISYKTYFNAFLFLPIAALRILLKLIPEKQSGPTVSGSDFGRIKNKFVNNLLLQIFNLEFRFLKLGLKYPAGVSLLYLMKKK